MVIIGIYMTVPGRWPQCRYDHHYQHEHGVFPCSAGGRNNKTVWVPNTVGGNAMIPQLCIPGQPPVYCGAQSLPPTIPRLIIPQGFPGINIHSHVFVRLGRVGIFRQVFQPGNNGFTKDLIIFCNI